MFCLDVANQTSELDLNRLGIIEEFSLLIDEVLRETVDIPLLLKVMLLTIPDNNVVIGVESAQTTVVARVP